MRIRYKTVEWRDGAVCLIDQTRLPHVLEIVRCHSVEAVAEAIRSMRVRGAPAIGVTAAYGYALGALQSAAGDEQSLLGDLDRVGATLGATRPTAVNLSWALGRMRRTAEQARGAGPQAIRRALQEEARRIADEDEQACRRIGAHGASLISSGDEVLTHCNTGGLAAVSFGTALGVIRAAHERGKSLHVWVDETRPFLQGARLTAWELQQAGIPCTLIADSMAAYFMGQGRVQRAIVGADRIAANGDVANKIGTYGLAILAQAHGVPFYVAAPTSTIDLSVPSGDAIPIEQRDPAEITHFQGHPIAPEGVPAAHPAFDVTPARYVTAIITEVGIHYPPYDESLARALAVLRPRPAAATPEPVTTG